MQYETTDISGHGHNLTNIGMVFNETRGVHLNGLGSELLFLDSTSGPRIQLLRDFTVTFWMWCDEDGGFLQWLDINETGDIVKVG